MTQILRGIKSGDFRSSLLSLAEQGWIITRTSGGHLRLSHPQASKTVFTSSTPSDFRVPRNLIAECNNALRIGRSDRPEPEHVANENAIQEALRRNKRDKRDRRRKPQAWGAKPETDVAKIFPFVAANDDDKIGGPIEIPERIDPVQEAQVLPPHDDQNDMRPQDDCDEMPVPKSSRGPLQIPKRDDDRPLDFTDLPVERESAHAEICLGGGQLLDLAIRLLLAPGGQILITPDMIGKTIAFAGEAALFDADPEL